MSLGKRELYRSPNGDCWYLVRDGERVSVRHEPNIASGGRTSEIDIGSFLRESGRGPQHDALLHLIGSLVED